MKTKYNNRNLSHLQIGTSSRWHISSLAHFQIGTPAYYLMFLLALFSSCTSDKNLDVQRDLKIEQYYPNSGQGGTLVTIKGEGFSESIDGNSVEFAGVKAEVFSAKENELVVLSPKTGQTGSIKINNGQKKRRSRKFYLPGFKCPENIANKWFCWGEYSYHGYGF